MWQSDVDNKPLLWKAFVSTETTNIALFMYSSRTGTTEICVEIDVEITGQGGLQTGRKMQL